jgi:hypothetical protein
VKGYHRTTVNTLVNNLVGDENGYERLKREVKGRLKWAEGKGFDQTRLRNLYDSFVFDEKLPKPDEIPF